MPRLLRRHAKTFLLRTQFYPLRFDVSPAVYRPVAPAECHLSCVQVPGGGIDENKNNPSEKTVKHTGAVKETGSATNEFLLLIEANRGEFGKEKLKWRRRKERVARRLSASRAGGCWLI